MEGFRKRQPEARYIDHFLLIPWYPVTLVVLFQAKRSESPTFLGPSGESFSFGLRQLITKLILFIEIQCSCKLKLSCTLSWSYYSFWDLR